MTTDDLFDDLAEDRVPEPPAGLDQEFHQRLNRTLLAIHTCEIYIRVLPCLLRHFCQAVMGAIHFTMTGQYRDIDDQSSNEIK